MRIVRFGEPGREKPGIVGSDGTVRDVSSVLPEIDAAALSSGFSVLRDADLDRLPAVPPGTRLGCPVAHVGHFIAVGLNYADHAAESGLPIPAEPILFSKAPSSIVGANDDVIIPKGSAKTDWEVEIAIVIGRRTSYVSESEAPSYVAGYTICNDVSEREWQIERGGTWTKGKGAPTFGPLGPWLVTPDEVGDVQDLGMWLDVNGERMQTGSTSTMIFSCANIVSYCSQFMIMEPGDVITTGTPPGVGLGMKPPRYLKAGDVMTLGIDKLGEQRQAVKAYQGR